MVTNMGRFDRWARLAIAAGLVLLAFGTSVLGGGLPVWIAVAVAAVFTLTAIVGRCPLYGLIGLKTCRDC